MKLIPQLENRKTDEHSIFLSYCWNGTGRANKIDEYLRKKGIEVTRDIRGVDNWQSLKDFMQIIRENDFAKGIGIRGLRSILRFWRWLMCAGGGGAKNLL